MRRSSTVLTAIAVAALALAPSFADARAGSGSSMGSRGGRTYSAPPSTNTAPSMAAPMDRSMTPRSAPSAPYGAPMQQPARSGFGSGLMGGLAGGLLGVGLGGLLMGNGFMGGGGGFGFIGLILQMALLFFVGRWLLRMFFNRQQPAMAGMPRMGQPAASGPVPMGGGGTGGSVTQPVSVSPADFNAFESLLQQVQAAWSKQDLGAMQQLMTPEMVGYFNEQLTTQSTRGLRNTVTDVKLEQGDLSEAWSEGGREYATVAMRFSMLDVTRDNGGRVVDGDLAVRTMATELWTFVRASGSRWILSAIQQTR